MILISRQQTDRCISQRAPRRLRGTEQNAGESCRKLRRIPVINATRPSAPGKPVIDHKTQHQKAVFPFFQPLNRSIFRCRDAGRSSCELLIARGSRSLGTQPVHSATEQDWLIYACDSTLRLWAVDHRWRLKGDFNSRCNSLTWTRGLGNGSVRLEDVFEVYNKFYSSL